MSDVIYVRGLDLEVSVGFHDWEQAAPQAVRIDLQIQKDTSVAANSDSVGDTCNYEEVIRRVRAMVQQRHYQLVETLASALAQMILKEFAVRHIKVCVAKPNAVSGTEDVGVVIERTAEGAN
jgi:dihydroneopterin aldolase